MQRTVTGMRYSINAIALATAASALSTSKLPPVVRLFGLSDLHVDYAANLETVKTLERPPGDGHLALIIAGDVTHNRTTLRDALTALRRTFDDVFYVPGNHEAWVTSVDRADGIVDSVAKLRACEALAEACGCTTRPRTLIDASGRSVRVAPLRGWYHASHDREPSVLPEDDGSRGFSRRWADYRKCRWPPSLLGRGGSEAVAHGMGAGDDALSAYFAATNTIARDNTPLVTFSHYSPRFECVPEKRFLLEPCLAKVSGSDHLGDLVLRLKPDVHVFGHTHIPIDLELDGTYYAQWPLGSPREQSRQCARAKALGPLELYRTDTGVQRLGQKGAPERTAWGQYSCSVLWGRVEGASRSRPTQVLLGKAAHAIRHGAGALGRVLPQAPGEKSARAARAESCGLRRRGRRAVAAQYRRAPRGLDGRRLHEGRLRRGICELVALVCATRFLFRNLYLCYHTSL